MSNSTYRGIQANYIEGIASRPNFVLNSSSKDNTANWATYADAAGTSPVDMTGGSATQLTFSRTTTGGEVLNGDASFKIAKAAANAQGQGLSTTFDIPVGYRNRVANIKFSFKIISGSISPGDLSLFLYDVTNSTVITPLANDLSSAGAVAISYAAIPSTCAQARIGFHFASTSTTAVTFSFDDFQVSYEGDSSAIRNITTQTGTSYTFALTDGSGNGDNPLVRFTNSGSITATVPPNSTTPFPVGTQIDVIQDGTGTVVFTPGSGVTINGPAGADRTTIQYSYAMLTKTGTNTWDLTGDVSPPTFIVATGGTITTDGNYKVHSFTSSGTFTISSGSGLMDILVVAGGGGGGQNNAAGGGGAGGYRYLTSQGPYSSGAYTVTVGAGGAGSSNNAVAGSTGGNSVFDTITSLGGGGGGGFNVAGVSGGSGGGAGNPAATPGSGTVGQGNNGGQSAYSAANNNEGGGGGGGAGAVGGNGTTSVGGAGGAGSSNSITGASVTYAGGGGGTRWDGSAGAGGSGGGGAGASGGANGTNGTANTGGGGGAGGSGFVGGNGGSGIVIVRYQYQ